jgi:hypothetical protein
MKSKVNVNSRNQLEKLENLAQLLAQMSIKNKLSSRKDDEQIYNSTNHHKPEKSTTTVLDDILFMNSNRNRKPTKDTIIKNNHEKTESNLSIIIRHKNTESYNTNDHHRKNSSIQIDKSYKVFGESFFPNNQGNIEEEDLEIHKSVSILGKADVSSYYIKILEFLSTVKSILLSKLSHHQDIDLDSISEEWVEILNEIITSLQSYFNLFSIINIEKFLLLEYIFCIVMFQNQLLINEKYLNTLKIIITLIDQNNLILFYLIAEQLTEYERTELFNQKITHIDKIKNIKSIISNEPVSQFNINLQTIYSSVKSLAKESVNGFKTKLNYKESYNMTLIHTYLTNISKNNFGDTKSKLDSIVSIDILYY